MIDSSTRRPRSRPQTNNAPASPERRVFVLGAGFSYAAGFPLAWQLLSSVYDRLGPEDRERIVEALKYLYPRFKPEPSVTKEIQKVQVEDFMSLLDMTEKFNRTLPTSFLKAEDVRQLQRALLRGIAQLLMERHWEAERKKKTDYVKRFIGRLRTSDTIVTFNWDLLLDRELRISGTPTSFGKPSASKDQLAVLKLHGSIDWYDASQLTSHALLDPVYRQLYRVPPDRLTSATSPLRPNAAPAVVPPTFFKFSRDGDGRADLEELWTAAFGRLQAAGEIHLCGYRLPPEDMYARFVLRRAIRANVLRRQRKGQAAPKVVLINPDGKGTKNVGVVLKSMRALLHADIVPDRSYFEQCRWAR